MAKVLYKNGVTSVVLRVFLQDTASSAGAGKTGLGIASAGLIIASIADNEAAATAYTAAGSTIETITTLGTFAAPTATKCRFKEVDATNLPGVYELQMADARWAVSNARSAIVSVLATGVAPRYLEVQLTVFDLQAVDSSGVTTLLTNLSALIATVGVAGAGLTAADDAVVALLATIASYLDTEVAAIKAKTDNLPTDPADASDIAALFASVASTLATIASYLDTEVAAIKTRTDLIPASPAAVGDIPTAAQNADGLIARNIAGGSDGGRTVKDVLRFNRNKVEIIPINATTGTLNVYDETDSGTPAWTAVVTRAAADALAAVDPT